MLKVVVVMRVLLDVNSLRMTVLVCDWDSWLVLMVIGNQCHLSILNSVATPNRGRDVDGGDVQLSSFAANGCDIHCVSPISSQTVSDCECRSSRCQFRSTIDTISQ
jgi:hypothetical protein